MKTATSTIVTAYGMKLTTPIEYSYQWEAGDDRKSEMRRKSIARQRAARAALVCAGIFRPAKEPK